MDDSDIGDSVSDLILSPSCEPVLVVDSGVSDSPGDEDGSSVNFSSADEAVEGLLGWTFCSLEGRGNRGAGESVMCGAVAVSENETSLSDGTDAEVGSSSDCERPRCDTRVAASAEDWPTLLLAASSIKL